MNSERVLPSDHAGAARRGTGRRPAGWLAASRSWRLIPQLDRSPRIVALAQTLPGRVLLTALFGLLLVAMNANVPTGECLSAGQFLSCIGFRRVWLVLPLLLAASAYAGRYRWHVVPLCTLVMLLANDFWFDSRFIARLAAQEGVQGQLGLTGLGWSVTLAVLLLSVVAVQVVRRYRSNPFSRRPIACMILLFAALTAVAASPLPHGMERVVLWSFVTSFAAYFWFLGYALREAHTGLPGPMTAQFGTFRPFWGSTSTPFGKGVSYLRKIESTNAQDLAVTQLKGLKLAAWVVVLRVLLFGLTSVAYGAFQFPTFDEAFARQLAGDPYPWYVGWGTLVLFFFEDLLAMAIFGGVIVACGRIAGFRLLRNTYRPLESQTVADFWNRYYFYYKELLVDFFFHPTFLTCFRKYKRLRLAFATFMAACVGNMVFHFMRDIHLLADLGLEKAVVGYQSHAFYTFVLALGIIASQLRRRQAAAPAARWARITACLRVALFFCILHVFDAPLDREHSLGERFLFLFHLFGVQP